MRQNRKRVKRKKETLGKFKSESRLSASDLQHRLSSTALRRSQVCKKPRLAISDPSSSITSRLSSLNKLDQQIANNSDNASK